VRAAHKINSPINQLQFFQMIMGAVLVRPKSTGTPSTSFYRIIEIIYLTEFCTGQLTACLMPSDQCDLTMAKAMGLIAVYRVEHY